MKYFGIIFDFNGTLFWDEDKQTAAWHDFAVKMRGRPMDPAELQMMHGRPNGAVMAHLRGAPVAPDELPALIQEKEKIYRRLCREDPAGMKLAPGAADLLDYLAARRIPRTIATSSERTNLDFFIEVFRLDRWFDRGLIVFDDGTFPGKPAPDIYLRASARLGLTPGQCVVVEDALSGLTAAWGAGIGRIIAIGPRNRHAELGDIRGVDAVVADFTEFDRKILAVGAAAADPVW